MDEDKVLKQLQSEIDECKKMIAEYTESRHVDVIFYKGRLQAYENVLKWIKNDD